MEVVVHMESNGQNAALVKGHGFTEPGGLTEVEKNVETMSKALAHELSMVAVTFPEQELSGNGDCHGCSGLRESQDTLKRKGS